MQPRIKRRVLFLYEGETEQEFFPLLFKKQLSGLFIQVKPKCLEGIFNLNKKVSVAIDNHLSNNKDIRNLYVVVEHDREGSRDSQDSDLDIGWIRRSIDESEKVKGIHDLVLTQMFESTLFIDIDGIYNFLRAPKSIRNPEKYKLHENFDHKDLNNLFRQISTAKGGKLKEYKKGRRTENFISQLDLDKIYNGCDDLKKAINFMKGIKNKP